MMDTEAFNHSFLLCTLNKKKKMGDNAPGGPSKRQDVKVPINEEVNKIYRI